MPSIIAAIFATQKKSLNAVRSKWAYALLLESVQQYWEIYINKYIFRFIPYQDHALEDGLWNLILYCQVINKEYQYDIHNNVPLILEEEFGKEITERNRREINNDIERWEYDFDSYVFQEDLLLESELQLIRLAEMTVNNHFTNDTISPENYIELIKMKNFVGSINAEIDKEFQ